MSSPGRGNATPILRRASSLLPRWLPAVMDQGLIAVTNFAMSIAIARAGGVGTLGIYALVLTAMLTTLGLVRMLVTEPWLASRIAGMVVVPELRLIYLFAASGSAMATEIVAILASGGRLEWLLAAPISLSWTLQDLGRYVAYKRSQPRRALLSDTAALIGTGLSLTTSVVIQGRLSVLAVLVAWVIGNLCGLACILREIAGPLILRGAIAWWGRICRRLSLPLVHESAAYMVGANVSLYLLAGMASNQDVGLVKIVSSVFSPLALAFTGLSMWLVPTLVHAAGRETEALKRRVALYLGLLAVPVLALAVGVGPAATRLIFGVSTPPSRLSLLLGGLAACAVAVGTPWVASAKVRNRYMPIAWARTVGAAAILAGLVAVPMLRSPSGYFALLLLQNVVILAAARFVATRPGRAVEVTVMGPDSSPADPASGKPMSK